MSKLFPILLLLCGISCNGQKTSKTPAATPPGKVITGAERTAAYLPLLHNKRVAVFANHTSMIGSTHLVDTLRKSGVQVVKVFGPEHGFRGTADAGEKVSTYIDKATGIPVISLYGNKRRPSAEDLKDVDILLFDIQDVGVRFYTYISSLEEYMIAALENNKPLIVLDRPNPNGFYVDGPVLDTAFRSFVGMQPVPVVYGMTMGEYALMIAGEKWLSPAANARYHSKPGDGSFRLKVIACENYDHTVRYELPVKPSPNLPHMLSVYWYPSTCFFEGTVLSEGRGTDHPFCYIGHPSLPKNLFAFVPTAREGASAPKFKDQTCYGWNLKVSGELNNTVQVSVLMEAYRLFPVKDSFFIHPKTGQHFFDKLAGTDQLRKQIIAGVKESAIRSSWEPQLQAFKQIRQRYLLYPDFE